MLKLKNSDGKLVMTLSDDGIEVYEGTIEVKEEQEQNKSAGEEENKK